MTVIGNIDKIILVAQPPELISLILPCSYIIFVQLIIYQIEMFLDIRYRKILSEIGIIAPEI